MSKNIQMQEKTSSGYDILYPQTIAAQIEDVYSKDETITTATKALYGLGATATPNQVFSAISTALDGKARIQTGSYVGTGTYGASNPCSLTFDKKILMIIMVYFTIFNNKLVYASHYDKQTGWIMLDSFLTTEYKQMGGFMGGRYSDDTAIYGMRKKSWDGKTFYWYYARPHQTQEDGPQGQMNVSGGLNYYCAFLAG